MGFGEKDGEEFDQVKVALVPVVELDVPDEFGVSGHVVVSDHAAVPPAAELHPDVSSDEVVRVRGRVEERSVGGGDYRRPFPPHGSEGIAVVGNGGESPYGLSPRGQIRGENLREDILPSVSPRTSPHVHWGLGRKWAR